MKKVKPNYKPFILACLLMVLIQWMFFTEDKTTLPIDFLKEQYQDLKEISIQNQKEFIQLKEQITNRDERINENTTVVFGSNRRYRDSLRSIINPAHR